MPIVKMLMYIKVFIKYFRDNSLKEKFIALTLLYKHNYLVIKSTYLNLN